MQEVQVSNSTYDPILFPIPEGIEQEDYIVATYLVETSVDADPLIKAAAIALEQTTGTWTPVPAETEDCRRKYAAKVIAVYSVPDYEVDAHIPPDARRRTWIMRLAYPWVNFSDNIPSLLSAVIGNISAMPNLKLIDLEFPRSYVKQFRGPKFGIEGVRKILGVYDRPILNNMIKPCTGFPPEVGADLFYQVAAGGVDWVKDDELLAGSPSFNSVADRVRMYMAAAERADKEKNEKTLYTVNITDETERLLENAKRAIDTGVNALMVNVYTTGFSALRALAEAPEVTVPVMVHTCMSGAMSTAPNAGMSTHLGAKLARMLGADIYLDYAPLAKFNALKEKSIRMLQTLQSPFYHIKPTLPLLGGGVTPGMVPALIELCGIDVAIGAGGGIHAHPLGPRAGAQAMRQAIDATLHGIPLERAAKEHEELRSAIAKWGIYGSPEYQKLFEIEQ